MPVQGNILIQVFTLLRGIVKLFKWCRFELSKLKFYFQDDTDGIKL